MYDREEEVGVKVEVDVDLTKEDVSYIIIQCHVSQYTIIIIMYNHVGRRGTTNFQGRNRHGYWSWTRYRLGRKA